MDRDLGNSPLHILLYPINVVMDIHSQCVTGSSWKPRCVGFFMAVLGLSLQQRYNLGIKSIFSDLSGDV